MRRLLATAPSTGNAGVGITNGGTPLSSAGRMTPALRRAWSVKMGQQQQPLSSPSHDVNNSSRWSLGRPDSRSQANNRAPTISSRLFPRQQGTSAGGAGPDIPASPNGPVSATGARRSFFPRTAPANDTPNGSGVNNNLLAPGTSHIRSSSTPDRATSMTNNSGSGSPHELAVNNNGRTRTVSGEYGPPGGALGATAATSPNSNGNTVTATTPNSGRAPFVRVPSKRFNTTAASSSSSSSSTIDPKVRPDDVPAMSPSVIVTAPVLLLLPTNDELSSVSLPIINTDNNNNELAPIHESVDTRISITPPHANGNGDDHNSGGISADDDVPLSPRPDGIGIGIDDGGRPYPDIPLTPKIDVSAENRKRFADWIIEHKLIEASTISNTEIASLVKAAGDEEQLQGFLDLFAGVLIKHDIQQSMACLFLVFHVCLDVGVTSL
jgi:hypothetical protein